MNEGSQHVIHSQHVIMHRFRKVFHHLRHISTLILSDYTLDDIICAKMMLNKLKYPVHLSKGMKKWSLLPTTVTKKNHYIMPFLRDGIKYFTLESIQHHPKKNEKLPSSEFQQSSISSHISHDVHFFGLVRGWINTYTVPNVQLSIITELGELAQELQSSTLIKVKLCESKIDKILQEIADVSIYLVHLTRILGIDLHNVY